MAAGAPEGGGTIRALLLGDAPEALESACAASGVQVTRSSSAAEARGLLARERFDLVDARLARPMPLEWEIWQRVELFYDQLRGHAATRLYQTVLREVERPLLAVALVRARGVRADAARALGIDRGTLARRLRALGMSEAGAGAGEPHEHPAPALERPARPHPSEPERGG